MTFMCVSVSTETQKYYLGNVVNTGLDNGYSGNKSIGGSDPHFGWKLGDFFVNGYTSSTVDINNNPVFLKTVGDTVTLWFSLQQDNLNKLNGNENLYLSSDDNGYDQYFGIKKSDKGFGHGMLIIRKTDYQNYTSEPVKYVSYLDGITANADTKVEICEEGDYEVAFNYQIGLKSKNLLVFKDTDFYNYRIFFKFSVRNGNCMVYPFDTETGSELSDNAVTENGFYLDLAKSRYLDINIKKSILTQNSEELTEDTRFNKPAKDGDKYTEEGVYTITVTNKYTNQSTTKKIYVGSDNVLKAYMRTGYSIAEINNFVENGAEIKNDGSIVLPPTATTTSTTKISTSATISETTQNTVTTAEVVAVNGTKPENKKNYTLLILSIFGGLVLISIPVVWYFKNKKNDNKQDIKSEEE
jgi:hypothetical protein